MIERALGPTIARILADPDDDAPRLEAALALDDPERGEHVRLGVELFRVELARALAAIEGEPLPPWPSDAIARMGELERRHRARWAGALGQRPGHGVSIERGFVGGLSIPGAQLLASADEELAAHPIDSLAILDPTAPLEALLALPIARRVSEISIAGARLSDADLEALAAWEPGPRCVAIHTWELPAWRIAAHREALLASPALRRLWCAGGMIAHGDEGVWAEAWAAQLEARHGLVPAVRPRIVHPKTRVSPRLVRELSRRGLGDRMIDRRPIAGTFRVAERDLYTTRHPTAEVFALLHARGYRWEDGARLHYSFTQDAEAGWVGGVYSLAIVEHDDAPAVDEIDRLIARGR